MNPVALQIQQPQLESPLNNLAKVLQVQGMQQDHALGRLKMDEYRRGVDEQNTLNRLYQSSVGTDGAVDRNKLIQLAASEGLGSKIPGLQKSFTESDKAAAEAGSKQAEAWSKATGMFRDNVGWIKSPEQAARFVYAMYQHPGLRGAPLPAMQDALSSIPSDTAALEGWKQQFAVGATKFMELNKPTFTTRNTGATTDTIATDGMTGKTSVVNTVQNTVSPDAKLSASTAKANRDAAQRKGDQDTEMKLGDDWRAQSKNFKEVADAHKTINSALNYATTSPVATLAGATKFMKMIDPGSVVRESELGMAMAATGVFDRATNYFNVLQSGKILTPQQVADFRNIANQVYQAAQEQQRMIDANYTRQANAYNLRPELIIQDLGQNATSAAGKASKPGLAGFKVLGVE